MQAVEKRLYKLAVLFCTEYTSRVYELKMNTIQSIFLPITSVVLMEIHSYCFFFVFLHFPIRKLPWSYLSIGILCVCVCVCVCACMFCSVWLFCDPMAVALQAPLSVGFSRQEYWSALPFPPPGALLHPGIAPVSLASPALAGRFSATCHLGSHRVYLWWNRFPAGAMSGLSVLMADSWQPPSLFFPLVCCWLRDEQRVHVEGSSLWVSVRILRACPSRQLVSE